MEDSRADNNHNIHSDDDHDEDDEDCQDEPSVIRPIEEESVRRIVAGQAVTDLASCVKELVDNALDAGSKSINIRLFNQGLDIVEVSDDGSGVPMDSRPFLATAHATSKIRAFEDIYTPALSTLGFRGEALFCLANLSEKLVVATRTEREPIAQRLEYKHDGSLDTSTVDIVPRKVGTTVAVLKLLNSLPVRRADMERRIAQHRAKMMKLMESYAIFSVGVRVNLMDMVDRKEKRLLATAANTTTLEQTMSSILGSKFLASVTPVSIDLTPALDPAAATAANADSDGDWKLEGYISKAPGNCKGGGGGKVAGQQYFSINGRPVELPKVARIIGDVWRTLGGKNKPSCVLTLKLPNQEYDVNLSPEKRQVLLTHGEAICQRIQKGITELWASQTEGQFVPSASQPADATASASSTTSTSNDADGKLPPKVDNIESLLSLQESNRKRALEKHSRIPTVQTRESNNDMDDDMDVDSQYGESNDSEEGGDEHARRRAYMRRFREEQKQQHRLNASPGDVDCQYGEEGPKVPEQQPQNEPSPRVRRRGGFVHDISTAKQWERPASIGRNLEIPEGIEDPSDSEDEAEQTGSLEKRQRTDQPQTRAETSPVETTDKLPPEDVDVSLDTPEAAIGEVCSSRRVTLQLNNELADSGAAASSSTEYLAVANLEYDSATGQGDKSQYSTLATSASVTNAEKGTSDGDKLLWVNEQARFNQCGASPEKEIDVLLKASVSPKQKFHTPHVKRVIPPAKATNSASALNLEQYAFRQGDERVDSLSRESTQPAVSPDDEAKMSESDEGQSQDTTSPRATPKANEQSPKSCGTDEARSRCKAPRRKIVWGSFNGTENAVAKTKQELQRVEDRKHILKQVRDDEEGFGKRNKVQKKVSLAKGDFAEMSIIGQFNLGFILAKDRDNHLWILDQHACDERFNFERLMASTVMHEQKLIAPMPLELDPSEESCVLDNMEIFNKNGFRFLYDENKPPRHRLALTALPHSGARDGRKAVNFGKEDVSALCAILGADNGSALGDDCMERGTGVGGGTGTDGSGMYGNNAVRRFGSLSQAVSQGEEADKILARLPKAIAMFASRACRSSIMIGTSLSKKSMETIVKRLDTLNFPFKCAHGRPTMTHVVDLQRTLLDDERKEAELVSGATISMSLSQPDDDGM